MLIDVIAKYPLETRAKAWESHGKPHRAGKQDESIRKLTFIKHKYCKLGRHFSFRSSIWMKRGVWERKSQAYAKRQSSDDCDDLFSSVERKSMY